MRTKSLLYLVIILVITLLLSSFGIANGHGPTDSPPDAGEAPVAPPPKEKTFTDLTAAEQHQALKENPNFFIENPEFAKDYYANLDNVGKVPEADAKFFAEGSNAVDNLEAATKFFQTADVKHIREAKDGAKQVFEKIYPGITFNLGVIEDDFKWNANEGTLFNGEKKFGGLNTLKDPDSTLPPQDKVVGIEAIKDGIIITYADGQKITIDGTGEVAVNLGQLGLEVFKDDNYYTLVHGEGASINVDGNKLTFTNFKSGSGHNLGRDYHFTGDLVVTPDTISSDNGEIKFNEYTINGAFEIKVNTNEINIWDSNGPTTFVHTDPKYRIPGHEGNMLMVKSGGQTKAERLTIHLEGIPDKIGEVQGEHVYLGIAEDGVNPIAALKGRGSIIPVQQTEGGIASLVDRSILTGKNNDAFVQVGYLVDKESLTGGGQVRISRGDQSIDFSNNNVRFEKTSSPNAEVLELSCKECNGQIGTVEKSVIANNEFLRIPAKLIADGTTVKAVIDPRYAGKLQGEVIGDNLVIFGEGENGQGVSLINGAVVRQRGAARTQQVGVAQQAGRVQLTTEQQEKVSEFERLRNARNIEGMKELASQMDPNLRRYLSSTTGINLDALSIPAYAEKITQYFNEIDKPRLGVIAWAKSVQRRMARKGIQLEFNENGDCTTEGCGQILQTEFNKRNANSHHIIKLYQSQALRDLALAEGAAALASSQPGGPGAAAVPGAPQPAAGRVKELQDRIAALRATKNNWNARYRITLENRRIARENAEIERQRVEAAVQMAENEALAAPLKDPESGMTETEKASYRARKAEAAALAQQRASDRDMVNQLSQSQTAIRNNRDRYQRQLNKANRERFTDNDQPERDLTTARNALRETNSALRAANRRVAAADARIAQLAEQETNPRARGHIYSAAGNEGEAAKAYQEASNALAELGQRDEGLQRNLFAASHRSVDPNSAGAAAQYEHAASVAATIEDEGVRAISAATIRHHTQVKPVMNAYIDSVNDAARANINSQSWSYGTGEGLDRVWGAGAVVGGGVGHVFTETISAGENYKDLSTAEINGQSYRFNDKDPDQIHRDANRQLVGISRAYQRMKEGADLDDVNMPDSHKAQANIWRKQRHGDEITDADRDAALLERMENRVKVVGIEKASPFIKQTQGQLRTAEAVARNQALVERVIEVEDTAGNLDIGQAIVEIAVTGGAAALGRAAAKATATGLIRNLARGAKIAEKIVDPLFEVAPKLIGGALRQVRTATNLLPPPGSADNLLRGAAGTLPPPRLPDVVPLVHDVVSDDKVIRTIVSPDRKTVNILEIDATSGVARRVNPDESPLIRSIADEARVKAQPYQPPTLRTGRTSSLDSHLDSSPTPQRPRIQRSGTRDAPVETRVWPESGQVQKIEMAADGTPKKITTVQPDGSVTIRETGADGVLLRGRTSNVAEKAQALAEAALVRANAVDLPLAVVENPLATLNKALSPAGRNSAENIATAAQILNDPGLRRALDDATLEALDEVVGEGVSLAGVAGKATDVGPLRQALESAADDLPIPNPGTTQVNKLGRNGVEIIKSDASGNVVKKIRYDGKRIDITEFGPDGKIINEVSDTLKNLADVSEGTAKYAEDIAGDVAAVSSAKELLDTSKNTFRHWLGDQFERSSSLPFFKHLTTRLTKIDQAITTAKAELKTALASGDEAAIRLANSKVRNLEIGYQAGVSARGRVLHIIIRPRSWKNPEKRALIKPKASAYEEALTAFKVGFDEADDIGAFILQNPKLVQNVENARSAYLKALSGYSRTAKVKFSYDGRLKNAQGFDPGGAPSEIYRGRIDDVLSPGGVDVRVSPTNIRNVDDVRAALHQEVIISDELQGVIPTARYRGVTEVGGRPGVAIDTISGTKFTGNPVSMTDAQITELGKEGIDKLSKHLDEAAKKGWAPDRVSFVKLDEAQKINGVKYEAGDLVFTDVHGWKAVAEAETSSSLIPQALSKRLDDVGKTPGAEVVDDVVSPVTPTPDITPTPAIIPAKPATWDANVGRWRTPDGRFAKNEVSDLYEWKPSTGRFHHKTGPKKNDFVSFDEVTQAQNARRQAAVSNPSFSQVDLIGGGKRETNILPDGKVEIIETDAAGTIRKRITSDGENIDIKRYGEKENLVSQSGGPISVQGKSTANEVKLVEDALNPKPVSEAHLSAVNPDAINPDVVSPMAKGPEPIADDIVEQTSTVQQSNREALRDIIDSPELSARVDQLSTPITCASPGAVTCVNPKITNKGPDDMVKAAQLNDELARAGKPQIEVVNDFTPPDIPILEGKVMDQVDLLDRMAGEKVLADIEVIDVNRIEAGILVQTRRDLYLITPEGIFTTKATRIDGGFDLTTGVPHTIAIDNPELNKFFRNIYDEAVAGKVKVRNLGDWDRWRVGTLEAVRDSPTESLHVANSYFDDSAFINPHGSHEKYIASYKEITDNNLVLSRLHQRFQEKGVPISLTDEFTPAEFSGKNTFATYHPNGVPRYRLFQSPEELMEFASLKYQFSSLDEAKSLLAREQVTRIAGHETMHHAYRRFLEPGQVEKWEAFVKSKFADPNHPYAQTRNRLLQLGYDEAEVVEEMFTYRFHFHATGENELSFVGFAADADEITMFKELDLLPPDYQPSAPKVRASTPDGLTKSFDELTASGGSVNCPVGVGAAGGLGGCKITVDTPEQLQKARDYQARSRAEGKELDIEYQGKVEDPTSTATDIPDTDFFQEIEGYQTIHPDTLHAEGDLVSVLDGRRPVALSPPFLAQNQIAGNPALQAAIDSGELVQKEVKYVVNGQEVTMVGIHRRGSTIGAQSVDRLEDIYQSGRSATAQGDREIGTILRYPQESIDEYIALSYPSSGIDEVSGVVPLRGLDPPEGLVDDVILSPSQLEPQAKLAGTDVNFAKNWLEGDGKAWLSSPEGQAWAKQYDDRSFVGRLFGGKVDAGDLDLARIGDDLPVPLRTFEEPVTLADDLLPPPSATSLDKVVDDLVESGGSIKCPVGVGAAVGAAACTAVANTPEQLEKVQKLQHQYDAAGRRLNVEYQGRRVAPESIDDLLPPPRRNLLEQFAGHKEIVEEMKDFKSLNERLLETGKLSPTEQGRLNKLREKYLTNNKLKAEYDTILAGTYVTEDELKAAGKSLGKVEDQVLLRVGLEQTNPTEHFAIISDYFGTEKYGHLKSNKFISQTDDLGEYAEEVGTTISQNARGVVNKYKTGFEASSGQRVTITPQQETLLNTLIDNEVALISEAIATGEIARRAADAGVSEVVILRQFNNDLADSIQRMVIYDGVVIQADGGTFRIGAGVSRIRESNGLDHVVGNQLRARQVMDASEGFQRLTPLQKLEVLEAMRYHDYGKGSMWNNVGNMQDIGKTGDLSGSHVQASVQFINLDRPGLKLKYGDNGPGRIARVANRHDHPHYLRIGEVDTTLSKEAQELARIQNVQYNAVTLADNMAGVRVRGPDGELIADKLVAGISQVKGNEDILSKAFSLDDKIGLAALERAGITKFDAIDALRTQAIENVQAALARGDITPEMALAYTQAFNDDFGAFAAKFMRRTQTPGETTIRNIDGIVVIEHRVSDAAKSADLSHPGLLYDSQRGTTDLYWDRVEVNPVVTEDLADGVVRRTERLSTGEVQIVEFDAEGNIRRSIKSDGKNIEIKHFDEAGQETGLEIGLIADDLGTPHDVALVFDGLDKTKARVFDLTNEDGIVREIIDGQEVKLLDSKGNLVESTDDGFSKGWMRDEVIEGRAKLSKAQKYTDDPGSVKSTSRDTIAKDYVYPEKYPQGHAKSGQPHPKAGQRQVGVEHRFLDEVTQATPTQKVFADQAKENFVRSHSIKAASEEITEITADIRAGRLDLSQVETLRDIKSRLRGTGFPSTSLDEIDALSKLPTGELQAKKLETLGDNFIQQEWQKFYGVSPTASWDAKAARWRLPKGQYAENKVADLYEWKPSTGRFHHKTGPKKGDFASFDEVAQAQNAKIRAALEESRKVSEPSTPRLPDSTTIDDIVEEGGYASRQEMLDDVKPFTDFLEDQDSGWAISGSGGIADELAARGTRTGDADILVPTSKWQSLDAELAARAEAGTLGDIGVKEYRPMRYDPYSTEKGVGYESVAKGSVILENGQEVDLIAGFGYRITNPDDIAKGFVEVSPGIKIPIEATPDGSGFRITAFELAEDGTPTNPAFFRQGEGGATFMTEDALRVKYTFEQRPERIAILDDLAASRTTPAIVDPTTPLSHRTKLQQHLGLPESDEFLNNPRIRELSETPMVPDPNAGLARREGQKAIPIEQADDYVKTGIDSISVHHYPRSTVSEVEAISDGIKNKLIAQGELTPDRFLEEVLDLISKDHKTLPLEELVQQSTHLRHEALLRAAVDAHPGLSYKFDFHTPVSLLEFIRADFRILLGASDNIPGDEILLKIVTDLKQTGSPEAQHALARLHRQTDFTSLAPEEVQLIKEILKDEVNRVMADAPELRRILGIAEGSEHAAKIDRLVELWEHGPELRSLFGGVADDVESYAKLQKLGEAWPNAPKLRQILGVAENSPDASTIDRLVTTWPHGPSGEFKSFVDNYLIPSTYEAGAGWAFLPDRVVYQLDGKSTITRMRDITLSDNSIGGFNRYWNSQAGHTVKSRRYKMNAIRSDWVDHTHRIAFSIDGPVGSRSVFNEYLGKVGFQRDPLGHALPGGGSQIFSADFVDIMDEVLTIKGYPAQAGLSPRKVMVRDPVIKKALEEGKSVIIKHEGVTIIIHSIPPTPVEAKWVGTRWHDGKFTDDLIKDTYQWDKATQQFRYVDGPNKGGVATIEEVTELQNARMRLKHIDITPPPTVEILENAGKRETRLLPSGKVEIIETDATGTIRKTIDSDGTNIEVRRFDESGTLSEPISGTKSTLDDTLAEEIDLVDKALGKKSIDAPTTIDTPKEIDVPSALDEISTPTPQRVQSWLENEGQAWLRTKEGQEWASVYDERSGFSKFFGKAELEDLNLENLGTDLPNPLISRTVQDDLAETGLSRWLGAEGKDWLKTKEGQAWAKQYDTRSFTSRLFSKAEVEDLNLPAIGDDLPVPLRSPSPSRTPTSSTVPPSIPSGTSPPIPPSTTKAASDDLLASFAEHQKVVAELEDFQSLNKQLMDRSITEADYARLQALQESLLTDQRLAAKYQKLTGVPNPTDADVKALEQFEKELLLRVGLDRTDPSEHFTIIRRYFGTEHLGKLDEASFVSGAQDVAQYSEDVSQTIQNNARSVIDHYRQGFIAQSGQAVQITPGQEKLLQTLVDNEVDLIAEALATGEIARRAAKAGVSEAAILKQFSDDLADSIQRMVIYDGVVMKVEGGSFRIGAGVSRLRESNGLDHVVGNQLRARQIMDASEGFQRLTPLQKLEVLEAMRYHDYGKGSMWNNVGVMTSDVGRQLSDSHVLASAKFINADRAKISLKYGDEGVARIKRVANRHDHPYYLRVDGSPEQRIKNLQYNAVTIADNMAGVRVRAPNGDIIGDKLVAAINDIPGNEEILSKAFRLSEGVGVDAIEASGSTTSEIIDALRLRAIENVDEALSKGLITPELARLHKQAINDDFSETAANFMRRSHTPGETTTKLENGIVVIEHRASKAAAEADTLHSGLIYDSQRGTTDLYWDRVYIQPVAPSGKPRAFDLTHSDGIVREIAEDGSLVKLLDDQGKPVKSNKEFTKGWLRDKVTTGEYKLDKAQKFTDNPTTVSAKNAAADDWVYPSGHPKAGERQIGVEHRFLSETTESTPAQSKFAAAARKNLELKTSIEFAEEEVTTIIDSIRSGSLDLQHPEALREVNSRLKSWKLPGEPTFEADYFKGLDAEEQIEMLELLRDDYIQSQWQKYYHIDGLRQAKEFGIISGPSGQQIKLADAIPSLGYSGQSSIELGTSVITAAGGLAIIIGKVQTTKQVAKLFHKIKQSGKTRWATVQTSTRVELAPEGETSIDKEIEATTKEIEEKAAIEWIEAQSQDAQAASS